MPTRDFKIDETTWDLSVSNGDFEIVSDQDAVKQGIAVRLQMFLGEYYLDEDIGVPWVQRILGKGANHASDSEIQEIIRTEIAKTPDVLQVITVDWAAGADRTVAVSYSVRTTYSTTPLIGQVSIP